MLGIESIPDLLQSLFRLLAATVAGGIIGLNRELTQKPAGLRTHALVALGSSLLMVTAVHLGAPNDELHPDAVSRVLQGILAGIGFLGGGVILRGDGGNVKGLTTAATVWVAAALGAACGIGHWPIATLAVIIALLVLVAGQKLEDRLKTHRRDPNSEEND